MYDPDDVDLATLRRQLRERSSHREELDHIHQRERADLSVAHQQVQHSLLSAHETLQDRQRLLYDGEKDLAKITASRQRQLQAKEEKIAQFETSCRELQRQVVEVEGALQEALEKQSACRGHLSTVQAGVEQKLRAVRGIESEIADANRAAASRSSTKEKLSEAAQVVLRRLEARAADLEQQANATTEATRRRSLEFTKAEAAYAAQASALKNSTDKTRQEIDRVRSLTQTVRVGIQRRLDDDEKSVRQHRKNDEDGAAELQAAQQVSLQRLLSDRDEALRSIRAAMARAVDDIKGRVEFHASQLGPLREESKRLFDAEVRLIAELGTKLGEAADVSIFDAKIAFGVEAKQQAEGELDRAQDQLGQLQRTAAALREECAVLDDVVAPLHDVASSIQDLARHIESRRAQAADDLATHHVAKATKQQQIDMAKAQVVSQRLLLDASADRRQDALDDVENRRQQLQAEQRTLDAEVAALDAKLQDNKGRGVVLDSTLEHVSLQRKALQADAEQRRDAARKAAATLLAQLEE